MIKTFIAKEPGRYVEIQRNFTMNPDVEHKIINAVTGYKMVIDIDRETYSDFLQEGSEVWIPYNKKRHVADMANFWLEATNGHLAEEA